MAVSASVNLTEQVLLLPVEERIKLVEKLLSSLNSPIDPEIEAAWAAESEARLEAVLSGKEKTISGEEVNAKMRARKRP
ncbi:MAG: addiction module protein [Candidatus Hydrogenedentes bacterium]|nr:addiction module protein [Candidatus Hydrogenedentota bacterium]